MADFEYEWQLLSETSGIPLVDISLELSPLVRDVYNAINQDQPDLQAVKEKLENLLSFLASDAGRTDGNCRMTDLFFCTSNGWKPDRIPLDYQKILADIGGTLHETIKNPSVAETFYSLPEQLLNRIRQL